MKILILNPHIDAQHKICQLLKGAGMSLLMPANADEAWQVLRLHGTSIELAVLHREGLRGGDPGIELLYKIKKDPSQSDLPIILTSESWTAEQCAGHQRTQQGANAYLRWPFAGVELLKTIDAVFGNESKQELPAPPEMSGSLEVSAPLELPSQPEVVLESTSSAGTGTPSIEAFSIQLEAPGTPPAEHSSHLELSLEPSQEISNHGEKTLATSLEPAPQTPEELNLDIPQTNPELVAPQPTQADQDKQIEQEMPYLFQDATRVGDLTGTQEATRVATHDPHAFTRAFGQPLGDAVVPGGAAQSPDTETLKKYLLLREQDVAALSAQLKAALDELTTLKTQYFAERSRAEDLDLKVQEQARKIEDFEREKSLALEGLQAEINELRFQTKAKSDKAKLLETQVEEVSSEIDRLKERVRSDIRKIRVRERELENRLEISKKDSEVILTSRENKIIELKRKLDVLEFNMDLLQDRYTREKEASAKLRDKLVKAAQVVRVAEGLLDEPSKSGPEARAPKDEDTQAS